MDPQVLERASLGDDLDKAVRSSNELRIGSADEIPGPADLAAPEVATKATVQPQPQVTNIVENFPKDGTGWVELLIEELMSTVPSMDDARAHTSRVLGALQTIIVAQASSDTARRFQQEKVALNEHVQALLRENTILKHAVAIQLRRRKEIEDRDKELKQVKQLASQYQEQLGTLEVNNYALTLQLKRAQQNNSIPERFHPDVF